MQFVKLSQCFINLDNVSTVAIAQGPEGQLTVDVTFLAVGSPMGQPGSETLRLTGDQAEQLIEWLERRCVVDLSYQYPG